MRQTPLYDRHVALAGRMVDFAGWQLPVQYRGIVEEHLAVRRSAGLFDVSHMGEIEVSGPDAPGLVDWLVTARVASLEVGQVAYSAMCLPSGGTVDDLLVYRLAPDRFLLVVNAANTESDLAWVREQAETRRVHVVDRSPETGQLALQGPKAEAVLARVAKADLSAIGYYRFAPDVEVAGVRCLVSRTGYTGEDGFEIYGPWRELGCVWDALLAAGGDVFAGTEPAVVPVGLGARDTLRLEAALPLYGHELSRDISPLEARLGPFVDLDKPFIGREALARQRTAGLERKVVGLRLLERGIARSDYPVAVRDRRIGTVTSGTQSPTLGQPIALALIAADQARIGGRVDVVIRDRAVPAEVVRLPFVPHRTRRGALTN